MSVYLAEVIILNIVAQKMYSIKSADLCYTR